MIVRAALFDGKDVIERCQARASLASDRTIAVSAKTALPLGQHIHELPARLPRDHAFDGLDRAHSAPPSGWAKASPIGRPYSWIGASAGARINL